MAGIIKKSYFSHLTDFLAMAPYPIFFRALKTIIMPNFMLLTESEQLKHISALLNLFLRKRKEKLAQKARVNIDASISHRAYAPWASHNTP